MQFNSDLSSVGQYETVITVTQLNVDKSIDISPYRFLLISAIMGGVYRMGTIMIPTSMLSSSAKAFEIGHYESASVNTSSAVFISKSAIKVTSHITAGWTWSGVEVLGIK